jgi:hypothetical protein
MTLARALWKLIIPLKTGFCAHFVYMSFFIFLCFTGGIMGGKYHLFSRKFISSEGKEYKVWWYWYWDDGKRIRKPAGSSQRLKREAQLFIEDLERQDRLARRKQPEPDEPDPQPFTGPRTFGEFAQSLYLPGANHLKRAALTDGAQISEATRKGHRSRLENYLIPSWGERPWTYFESEAFPDAFTDWLVDLERMQTLKAGAATTRKPAISCISSSQNPQKNRANFPIRPWGFYLVLLPHECMFHAVTLTFEQENVSMVRKPVDHRRRHLVIRENSPPL